MMTALDTNAKTTAHVLTESSLMSVNAMRDMTSSIAMMNALNDLLLTDNKLKQVRPEMLFGLKNVTTLRVEQNFIEELPNKLFASMKTLNKIDLSKKI